MADQAESRTAAVNGIRLHYLEAGEGAPMVLLHGWPQTSFAWRKVIPALAERFRVIAPDLRGMGDSDKPDSGYDMRTVSTDIRELLRSLRLLRPCLVGHDWGGLVARRFALDWPGEASRIAILDIVPHGQILRDLSANIARGAWHYFFNAVPDLPESLVHGRVREFLRIFFRPKCHNPAAFLDECLEEYTRAYSPPDALRGGFNYYRAMFGENRVLDSESEGLKIREPILCLWGNDGGMGGTFDVVSMWKAEAEDVRGFGLDACGHYLAEERPDIVVEELMKFAAED